MNTQQLEKKKQIYLHKLKKYEREMLAKLKQPKNDTKS